jgi:hypothetical protein
MVMDQRCNGLHDSIFEPIMDPMILIDLSIALLILYRVGANLQPYEPRFLNESSMAVPPQQVVNDKVDPSTIVTVLGSPLMALFGTLALVFSCMANSSYNIHSTLLADGLHMALQQIDGYPAPIL